MPITRASLAEADAGIHATIHEVLDFLTKSAPALDELLAYALKVGELNLRVMALSGQGQHGRFRESHAHPGSHPSGCR